MKNLIISPENFPGMKVSVLILVIISNMACGQATKYNLYPFSYDTMPGIKSPTYINDSVESILIVTKEDKFALAPVTVENGKPLLYSYKVGTYMGKDQQLLIDKGDFPELAKTGLHSDDRLDNTKAITGIPTEIINCTGRPNAYSTTGFMAEDEDIISVLKSDNRTVQKLGLTHPQLARPLYHIWNLILLEYESGNWGRFYDNIKHVYYNENILNFQASGSKGWQISIFLDEIQGRHNIHIERKLTEKEEKYLREKYVTLSPDKMNDLKFRLSNLDFSEMLPYYIMRYGFYEGHTGYRTDPVSVAFIFGLRSLEQIDKALEGKLYNALFDHFVFR
ncbi:MAG TPA: hypothetical protein P5180_07005 [Bacteroidales bacterium]|nr:hypothetical protein [Bacteroidales bacterium]